MNDTLLKVGWKLGKVWRYIYIFTQGGLDTREDLEIYFLRVGWILGKVWRYIYIFTQGGLDTREVSDMENGSSWHGKPIFSSSYL